MGVKTFKFRLYPTKAQRSTLTAWLNATRWVYNKTVEVRKAAWEKHNRTLRLFDTNKLLTQWKEAQPWLREIHSQVLQNAQYRVDLAFQGFFRRVKAGATPGYPRFRGKERYDSICFPQYPGGADLEGAVLRVRKIGNLRLNLHRAVEGRIKTTTIKVTPTGKWFVCFVAETATPRPLKRSKAVIGLDLGLENFATASTGAVVPNPRFFRKGEKALAKTQRKLSAAKRGTEERARRRLAMAHVHEKIRNRRLNFAHKLSAALVRDYGVICVEDLNTAGMIRNHCLAKSISDAAWNTFVRVLSYKAEEAGRTLAVVNPAYTSQTCSRCGHVAKKALGTRQHCCKICGLKLGRDHNAAINILRLGLQSLASAPRSPAKRRA